MAAMMTEFREDIIDLIETTFQGSDPVFTEIKSGRLPRFMGEDGDYAGVSPETQTPTLSQQLDQQTSVLVQFYMKYEKTRPIDKKLVLDPGPVEDVVQRFQEAVQGAIGTDTSGERWFYNLTSISYPPDPVGQKTRAEIVLTAHGTNPAIKLTETVP